MRNIVLFVALFLGALSAQAQEKVVNILNIDGSTMKVRVADLKEISFLSVDAGNQGVLVKTLAGQTLAVIFTANPVLTVIENKLVIKSDNVDNVELDLVDVAEIQFGDVSGAVTTLPGDANNDGTVSVSDLTMIANYILNGNTIGMDLKAADANKDGAVSVADLTMVANIILSVK